MYSSKLMSYFSVVNWLMPRSTANKMTTKNTYHFFFIQSPSKASDIFFKKKESLSSLYYITIYGF